MNGKQADMMMHAPAAADEGFLTTRLTRAFRRARPPAAAASPLDPSDAVWAPFWRELSRSRRYERSFVLIRINGGAPGSGSLDPGSLAQRAQRAREFVRDVDVTWVADDHVFVLLPECERAEGERFVERVVRDAPAVFSSDDLRLASFPADGCTSGALLAALDGHPLPPVRPRSARLRAVGDADRGDSSAVHGNTT